MKAHIKYWIIGVSLAILGIILARIIPSRFAEQAMIQLILYFCGISLALVGLGVILFGMRKK